MTITLNGTTGVVAPEFDGPIDASNLTGALPAIDGSALTGISTTPTTAQVLSATAGATAGAVGTYGFLLEGGTNLALRSVGSTIAGSSLLFASIGSNNGGDSSVTPSGTWRLMGSYNSYTPSNDSPVSVWLRIS